MFVRYEARIVALELRQEEIKAACDHYWPIVERLRDADLVAQQIAERLQQTATMKLTKVHVAIAAFALFLPSIVGALLTYALVRLHG